MKREGAGKVWLVGAGPNDPGLMTLKGKAVLEQAEVVVYDHLISTGILAMIPKGVKMINVRKISENHHVPQNEINQILVGEALQGKRVVRLKGGDPFIFARGDEELEMLCKNGIPFEVVPGITSAISVPAYSGIPVTHRDFCSSLHIITGHTKNLQREDIDFPALVKFGGTLIFLMGVASMSVICKELTDAGMDPAMPASVLENGTSAHQRRVVSDLEHLAADAERAEIQSPAIIVVGKVCSLAEQFSWAEDRPLGRLKIMIPRPEDTSSDLTVKLQDYGAEVIDIPVCETVEAPDDGISWYDDTVDYVAFTSASMIRGFVKMTGEIDHTRVEAVCIEEQTAKEAEKYGMQIHISKEATMDSMAKCFLKLGGAK